MKVYFEVFVIRMNEIFSRERFEFALHSEKTNSNYLAYLEENSSVEINIFHTDR